MRQEKEIFDDLLALCTSPGYIHALATICFHDNMVPYAGELSAADFAGQYSPERLIRTEVNALVGLLIRRPIDFGIPSLDVTRDQIRRSYELLHELHQAMLSPTTEQLREGIQQSEVLELFGSGSFLREPIF